MEEETNTLNCILKYTGNITIFYVYTYIYIYISIQHWDLLYFFS